MYEASSILVGTVKEKKQKHSSDQRIENREDIDDWISCLPDCLLLHILSFLKMTDAITMSFVSRRWRYLWRSIPTMDFIDYAANLETIKRRNSIIDTSLMLRTSSRIQKICVLVYYEDKYGCASQIDSLIEVAIQHKVEELNLKFHNRYWDATCRYKLPSCIFNCASLTTLTLDVCDLNLPPSICLSSLKTLCLRDIYLTDDMIKVLTSGSPLLENLDLQECLWEYDLNIFTSNLHLTSLKIFNSGFDERSTALRVIQIYAPNLQFLEYVGSMPTVDFSVRGMSSLVAASFDFQQDIFHYGPHQDGDFCPILKKLLDDLCHAKTLKLSSSCLQVLSTGEVRDLCTHTSSINATNLRLNTSLKKWELPGIAYLLRSSHNLETLIIQIRFNKEFTRRYGFKDRHDFDERDYWKLQEHSFSSLLQHLKMVKICGFMGGSYFSTRCKTNEAVEEFLRSRFNEIELVKFLLQNSRVLEKMIISITKNRDLSALVENPVVLIALTKELQTFPRASPNAKIIFS